VPLIVFDAGIKCNYLVAESILTESDYIIASWAHSKACDLALANCFARASQRNNNNNIIRVNIVEN